MIGRAAYHDPLTVLGDADRRIFGDTAAPATPEEVIAAMTGYIARHCDTGGRVHDVTRHMLGLFAGQPGARLWRRHLSTYGTVAQSGPELLTEAYELVLDAQARSAA